MFKKNIFRIGDVGEEKGITGHGSACGTTVFLLDDCTELLDGEHTTTYIEEGADDGTHHVAEETVGSDGELPLDGADLFPMGMHDAAVVGLHVGVQFGEGGEVGVVEKGLCCFVHLVEVEGLGEAVGVRLEGSLGGDDIIMVRARGGGETGVGIGFHFSDVKDGDV